MNRKWSYFTEGSKRYLNLDVQPAGCTSKLSYLLLSQTVSLKSSEHGTTYLKRLAELEQLVRANQAFYIKEHLGQYYKGKNLKKELPDKLNDRSTRL